jgi:hypothetical protein
MLVRNASLLSPKNKREYEEPGFLVSFLTHVAVPQLDYTVMEGCCAAGCAVEFAPYRCARCFVARYCGKEHMTSHWPEHKPHCVPLAQRGPKVTLDCSEAYLDNPDHADDLDIECRVVPRKTFPGVTVVKIQLFSLSSFKMTGFKICDPNGVLIVRVYESEPVFDHMRQLFTRVTTMSCTPGYGYFDADMTQEDQLTIFFDHSWKCTW